LLTALTTDKAIKWRLMPGYTTLLRCLHQ
jgi:hypothetical protein